MKPLLFLISLTFNFNSLLGQTTEFKETYPDKYTFGKAMEFEQKGQFDKTIWVYINLYPQHKIWVADLVKAFAINHDTIDMGKFIQKTFNSYSIFDPSIISIENGQPIKDFLKFKNKEAWADELSIKIKEPEKPLSTAAEYNQRSMERYRAKDYLGTIFDLSRAIEKEPFGEYYYNRAFTKSMINDYRGAEEDYNNAIVLNYKLAEAYFERGFCKDMTNNLKGAIDDYTSAIGLKKDFTDAYNNRGFVYYKQKNFKKAILDFDEAIKLKPDFARAYVNRAFAKKDLKRRKGACADWIKAMDLGYKDAAMSFEKYCK
ncbi:MAG: tetratricopeptide repeat protein [Bacteroidia bacterium]